MRTHSNNPYQDSVATNNNNNEVTTKDNNNNVKSADHSNQGVDDEEVDSFSVFSFNFLNEDHTATHNNYNNSHNNSSKPTTA